MTWASHNNHRLSWLIPGGIGALSVIVPWWRNHDYIRDFYDYGMVMAGVGRVADGESPYVDFGTPIQSAVFLANRAAESMGGGTYLGMTIGNAVFIVLSVLLLTRILARKWSPAVSAIAASAVVVASAGQHTIIWYNAVGVVCLAVAAWLSATAPVMSRSSWRAHSLIGTALFLGGFNKLNFQLVALAAVAGWALRAALTGRASWKQTGMTLLFAFGCGAVLPVLFELAWTGATLSQWWYNVATLPAGGRLQLVTAALSSQFYLHPPHDYYGQLLLPAAGLVGILTLAGAVLATSWKGSSKRNATDRLLLAAAALCAGAGAISLLATNREIAYLGLAGCLVLAIALWLGFEGPTRGNTLRLGIAFPALVVAIASWHGAWLGQRSQFGHSAAERKDYRPATSFSPAFEYLGKTKIPPEIGESLQAVVEKIEQNQLDPGHVFLGPGLEFLIREIPVNAPPLLPLGVYWETSYGSWETGRLAMELSQAGSIRHVFVPQAWDDWYGIPGTILTYNYRRASAGPVFSWYEKIPPDKRKDDPFLLADASKINVHPGLLKFSGESFGMYPLPDDELFLGIHRGTATLDLQTPSFRISGKAVIQRFGDDAEQRPIQARFQIELDIDGTRLARWDETIELPAGSRGIETPFLIDSSGRPIVLQVTLLSDPEKFAIVGWQGPTILHAVDGPEQPPVLRGTAIQDTALNIDAINHLFGEDWDPDQIVIRGGNFTDGRLEMTPGGEIWVRPGNSRAELSGRAFSSSGELPPELILLRGAWYKGGRLELTSRDGVRTREHPGIFHAWTAEPGGWLGLLIDPVDDPTPVIVEITNASKID